MTPPTEPHDLPGLVRRSARTTRIAVGVTVAVVAAPLLAVGAGAAADGAVGIGGPLLAVGLALPVLVFGALRRRYGRDGARWVGQLRRTAAAADGRWRDVEVWLVRPSLTEATGRSQCTALLAPPGGRPDRASKLLVGAGIGRTPGVARVWETAQGPALLEVDGVPWWPSQPTRGRLGAAAARAVAALPLSGATLERPRG